MQNQLQKRSLKTTNKMNKLLLLFSFSLLFVQCKNSQNNIKKANSGFPCDCTHQNSKIYNKQAYRLAIREIQEHPTHKEEVLIKKEIHDKYLRILCAVKQSGLKEVEAIKKYRIKTFPYPHMKSISLYVDHDMDWLKNWHEGNRKTGNKAIDELMEKYHLREGRLRKIGHGISLDLISSTPLNVFALSDQFKDIEGIIDANPGKRFGDGNDIEIKLDNKKAIITYSYGFEDCPSKCIKRHYWQFKMDKKTGKVSFMKEYGDSLK